MTDELKENNHFRQLEQLIIQRQLFEESHPDHPDVIAKKTGLNFADIHGKTLLNYAVETDDLVSIESLIDRGVKLSIPDLSLALNSGNIKLAEWIFDRITDCTNLLVHQIDHPIGKEWLSNKVKTSLEKTFNTDAEVQSPPILDKFMLQINNPNTERQLAMRCAEQGRLDYFTQSQRQNVGSSAYVLDVLTIALINHHDEIAKKLIDEIANMQSKDILQKLLKISINNKNFTIADYLLTKGTDINLQDAFGKSNLSSAIESGEIERIDYVLSKNPILTNKDVHGRSILHLGALTKDARLYEKISALPLPDEYKNAEDIYGHTPEYYLTAKDIINISQSFLTDRISYFLTLNYSTPPFDLGAGVCNGLSHLIQLYAEDNKEDYFYQTIRLMNSWDGTMEGLLKPFDDDLPQSKYYKNLFELFQQWTNDILGFQLSSISVFGLNIAQNERVKQHQLLSNDPGKKPVNLFSPTRDIMFNEEQIREILFYYQRMPSGTRLEFGGGNHQTSSRINKDGEIVYYDPNLFQEVKPYSNINEFIEMFVTTKYIANNKLKRNAKVNVEIELEMYFFTKNSALYADSARRTLAEHIVPSDENDARTFQEKSPNKFTPLHIALIARDLETLKKLLTDGFCDINAANRFGQTPLDLAIESNFVDAARLIILHKDFNTQSLDNPKSLITAYKNDMRDVIDEIIGNPNSKNLVALFQTAAANSDFELINRLIDKNKIDLNPTNTVSPLIVAMHNNCSLETIDALVRKGAKIDLFQKIEKFEHKDIIKYNPANSTLDTPLLYALNHQNINYLSSLISATDVTIDRAAIDHFDQRQLFKLLDSCMENNHNLFCQLIRDLPLDKIDWYDLDSAQTFLHKAMLKKELRLVEALLVKGCSVSKPIQGFMQSRHDCIEYMKSKNFPDKIIQLAEAQTSRYLNKNQPSR